MSERPPPSAGPGTVGAGPERRVRLRIFGGMGIDPGPEPGIHLPVRSHTVLAALILARGAGVTYDELITLLWGTDSPRTARNQLHRLVSHVRQAVDGGASRSAPSVVLGAGEGYRLAADCVDCDLYAFDVLTERAREDARSSNAEDALSHYVHALELARRPAFVGLETHLAEYPDYVALERERARTATDALTLALRHRVSQRLVKLVEDIASRSPFDEALQAQLIRALARVGRRSDALDLAGSVRRSLRDELGLDPGSELRAAQAEVLNAGGVLTDVSTPRPARLVRPAQLPAVPPHSIERPDAQAHLDALTASPMDGRPVLIAAIGGMGGIGKTTLAVTWAHQVADQFPDGQLYVDLRGFDPAGRAVPVTEALSTLLMSLGLSPVAADDGGEARSAQLRSVLSGKRMLILLDNARDAEQVRPLLPGSPGCMVIVTSRSRLVSLVVREGAVPIHLDRLPDRQARELVLARLGGRVLPAASIDHLVDVCAGLPLALSLMTARLVIRGGAEQAPTAGRWSELGPLERWAGERDVDLQSVFASSLGAVSVGAARLFRLAGVHPGESVTLATLASIAGATPEETRSHVDELSMANLFDEGPANRFKMHDLLRQYAVQLAAADPESGEAERRLVDHYVASTRTGWMQFESAPIGRIDVTDAEVTPAPITNSTEAITWYRTERTVLPLVIALARERGYLRAAANIAIDWRPMNAVVDSSADSLPHELDALGAAAALGDPLLEAELARVAAARLAVMDDPDAAEAHLARARQLYEVLDDLAGQSMVLRTSARVSIVRGDYEQAVARATGAAEMARSAGRADLETLSRLTVGEALYELGRWTDSVAAYRDGLASVRSNGWTYLEMLPRVHILRGLLRQHRYDDVVLEGEQALAVARGEDPVNEAAISAWIATAAMRLEDTDIARESCGRFRALVGGFEDEVLRTALEDEFDDCLRAVDTVEEWLRGAPPT